MKLNYKIILLVALFLPLNVLSMDKPCEMQDFEQGFELNVVSWNSLSTLRKRIFDLLICIHGTSVFESKKVNLFFGNFNANFGIFVRNEGFYLYKFSENTFQSKRIKTRFDNEAELKSLCQTYGLCTRVEL